MKNKNIIAISGIAYIGLSLACLLAQNNKVYITSTNDLKIEKINKRISTIKDDLIVDFFKHKELDLEATRDDNLAYSNADYIIVANMSYYDRKTNFFDTGKVERTIEMQQNTSSLYRVFIIR